MTSEVIRRLSNLSFQANIHVQIWAGGSGHSQYVFSSKWVYPRAIFIFVFFTKNIYLSYTDVRDRLGHGWGRKNLQNPNTLDCCDAHWRIVKIETFLGRVWEVSRASRLACGELWACSKRVWNMCRALLASPSC